MAKKRSVDHLFAEDEVKSQKSEFEALLEQASMPQRNFLVGDRFKGEILALNGNEAFVSTGTATDAVLPFAIHPNQPSPQVGDVVDVVVMRVRDGSILVKIAGSRGLGIETDSLEDAFKMEIPVEGLVTEEIKGGFRVKVLGQKAFCPISQMDLRVVRADDYLNKKFQFLITKWERGRDLVVSRRKLLDGQRMDAEKEFLSAAKVDDVFSATVFRLEKYGAFVRLPNGVEGLVPVGEISFSRINHPQDLLNLDQQVQVKLTQLKEEAGRLRATFSIKQGGSQEDPWQALPEQFPLGSQTEGVIENKESFGLFVNISAGITGLLPRSAWREHADAKMIENKRRGERIKVQVEKIDLNSRRLSLCLPGEAQDESWRDHTSGTSAEKFGSGTMANLLQGVKSRS